MRFYQLDLLDFYRGILSGRRLEVLIRHLPAQSALVAALNGGKPPFALTDHLVADLWVLTAQANSQNPKKVKDHPARAAMRAKTDAAARQSRLAELKADYDRRRTRRGYR